MLTSSAAMGGLVTRYAAERNGGARFRLSIVQRIADGQLVPILRDLFYSDGKSAKGNAT
jgi:hypothetical protein